VKKKKNLKQCKHNIYLIQNDVILVNLLNIIYKIIIHKGYADAVTNRIRIP
jgi:hypothetical protein